MTTRRGQQNRGYAMVAWARIKEWEAREKPSPELAAHLHQLFTPKVRVGVLAELGRIHGPKLFWDTALVVAGSSRKTTEIAPEIRSLRRAVKMIEKARSDAALPTEALHYYFEPHAKVRVLMALGRVDPPERLLTIALAVAEAAPPEQEALDRIREFRLRPLPQD